MSTRDNDYHNYLSSTKSRSPKRSETLSSAKIIEDRSDRRPSPIRESVSKKFLQELNEERHDKSVTNWSPNRSRMNEPEDGYRTPRRDRSLRATSRERTSQAKERLSPLRGNEEEILANVLKDQISLDNDIESLRNELALKSDFNLLDAFKIFDLYERGYITAGQLEDGLREFSVYPSRDELNLIFKKFDKDGDGFLRYSEFADIFKPRNREYAEILANRDPSYSGSRRISSIFGYETRKAIQRFFNMLLQNEEITENIRQKLSRRPLFDVYDAFKALDKNRNGYITLNEFKEMLLDHGVYTSPTELKQLLQRFDRDQDGKVSYREFAEEISPKSPRRGYA